MKKTIAIFACLIVTACANGEYAPYKYYLQGKGLDADINPHQFQHCYGYGCDKVVTASLSEQDWRDIEIAFLPKPKDYKQEQDAIKRAIGLFEQKVGAQTGTDADKWGTFRNAGQKQHDCVDESTNTTIYLAALEQRGLLQFHNIETPQSRLPLIHAGRWPHQSAVISEKRSRAPYAVDSWFHDNGHPAEIVPLKQWKEGWKPKREDASSQNL